MSHPSTAELASGHGAPHERASDDQRHVREMTVRRQRKRSNPLELDRLIHERVRLAIVGALAAGDTLSFNELKKLLGTSDGNLSVHARRLEEAGYIDCRKSFDGRVPRTDYSLTRVGRTALHRYLDHMEALIHRVREG